jgi:hypothetical protein
MTRCLGRFAWPLAAAVLLVVPTHAAAQGARLNLDGLASLAARAAQVTDVTLDPGILQMASGFLSSDKSGAEVKDLVAGLQGVYVKNFEFKEKGAYDQKVVDPIRKQLAGAGWSKMVSTREDDESVDIYAWQVGSDGPGGLAILVMEPTELTVVNIVGKIDLKKLAARQGQMGIPSLPAMK